MDFECKGPASVLWNRMEEKRRVSVITAKLKILEDLTLKECK